MDDVDVRAALEGRRAGQAVVDDTCERVLVDPPVERAAVDLLRRQVVGGADDVLLGGQRRARGQAFRQAEVAEPVVALLDQDVRRLDVAVDQAGRVRGVQRRTHLRGDARDLGRLLGALIAQQGADIGPAHQLHRDVERALDVAGVVDRDDVGMVERGGQPRFAHETLAEVAGQARREQLERHGPPQMHVLGAVDDAHPAAAEHVLDAVARDLGAGRKVGREQRRAHHDAPGHRGLVVRARACPLAFEERHARIVPWS